MTATPAGHGRFRGWELRHLESSLDLLAETKRRLDRNDTEPPPDSAA